MPFQTWATVSPSSLVLTLKELNGISTPSFMPDFFLFWRNNSGHVKDKCCHFRKKQKKCDYIIKQPPKSFNFFDGLEVAVWNHGAWDEGQFINEGKRRSAGTTWLLVGIARDSRKWKGTGKVYQTLIAAPLQASRWNHSQLLCTACACTSSPHPLPQPPNSAGL